VLRTDSRHLGRTTSVRRLPPELMLIGFGCKTWAVCRSHVWQFESFHMWCLQTILVVTRVERVPHVKIFQTTGCVSRHPSCRTARISHTLLLIRSHYYERHISSPLRHTVVRSGLECWTERIYTYTARESMTLGATWVLRPTSSTPVADDGAPGRWADSTWEVSTSNASKIAVNPHGPSGRDVQSWLRCRRCCYCCNSTLLRGSFRKHQYDKDEEAAVSRYSSERRPQIPNSVNIGLRAQFRANLALARNPNPGTRVRNKTYMIWKYKLEPSLSRPIFNRVWI